MAEQDGFTPQEAAYFESGGAQMEGLADAAQSASEAAQQSAAQQEGQAAQQAQQQQDQTQSQNEPRTVPLAALQEERAERRRLRDELNQMREQQNALVQRLLASQQQTQEQPPQIPDFQTDPVGHLRAQNEMLARQLQQVTSHIAGQQQQTQQMTQVQRQQQEIQSYVLSDEARFKQQAPDYDQAAQFLQESRAQEYRALGMTNPMEIAQALQQDIVAMVQISQRNGTSVAEAAYNLAKARGYKAQQQQQQAQQDNAMRIAAISQGQQHAASLSQAGGGAAPAVSIERLLAMSDAEFAKATAGSNWQTLNAELSR